MFISQFIDSDCVIDVYNKKEKKTKSVQSEANIKSCSWMCHFIFALTNPNDSHSLRFFVQVYHFKEEMEICNYSCSNTILDVDLNQSGLMVVASIAFSLDGMEIPTISGGGTVIHVFSLEEGSKLIEFRRGVKRFVSVSSLFSICSE